MKHGFIQDYNMTQQQYMKKTRHEGDESTVAFWYYMKALYKDEE